MELIIYIFAGIVAGAAITYILMKERVKDLKAVFEKREQDILSDETRKRAEFKAIASEIMESNSRSFRESSGAQMEDLLRPIRESFSKLSQNITDSRVESARYTTELQSAIKNVMERSQMVSEEASKLANAITGQVKYQGNFGEVILERILKSAGLVEGLHYESQGRIKDEEGRAIRTDDGKELQPDIILYYPDDTAVIIDSKASLTAYNNYMNSDSQEMKDRYAREHIQSVSKHVDEMASKNYNSYIPAEKRLVDFNIMFMPVESAFQLMMTTDPSLWETARKRGVLIVSQMNLLVFLQMIGMGWKQALQEKNIREVYRMAGGIRSQLEKFLEQMDKVGTSLDNATKTYNEAVFTLKDSKQSVINKSKLLEEFGVKIEKRQGGKGIPARFRDA